MGPSEDKARGRLRGLVFVSDLPEQAHFGLPGFQSSDCVKELGLRTIPSDGFHFGRPHLTVHG